MNAETENKIGEALDILLEHNLITPSQALEIDEIVSKKINKENLIYKTTEKMFSEINSII